MRERGFDHEKIRENVGAKRAFELGFRDVFDAALRVLLRDGFFDRIETKRFAPRVAGEKDASAAFALDFGFGFFGVLVFA